MKYTITLGGEPCSSCGCCSSGPIAEPAYRTWRILDYAMFGEVRNPLTLTASASDIRSLDARVAADTIEDLKLALLRLDDPATIPVVTAMYPNDSYWPLSDAISTLARMLRSAVKFPRHRWRIM